MLVLVPNKIRHQEFSIYKPKPQGLFSYPGAHFSVMICIKKISLKSSQSHRNTKKQFYKTLLLADLQKKRRSLQNPPARILGDSAGSCGVAFQPLGRTDPCKASSLKQPEIRSPAAGGAGSSFTIIISPLLMLRRRSPRPWLRLWVQSDSRHACNVR